MVLRLHFDLDIRDPWSVLAGTELQSEPFYAWNDGRTGLCAAGIGHGTELRASSDRSFTEARRLCAELFERVVDVSWPDGGEPRADVPHAFGGFAFDALRSTPAQTLADQPQQVAQPMPLWAGWPQSVFYVPAVLVYRQRRGLSTQVCGVVVSATVGVDESTEQVAARIDARIGGLLAAARRLSSVAGAEEGVSRARGPGSRLSCQLLEDRAGWCQRVAAARAAVSDAALDKVVLARAADFRAPAGHLFDPVAMLETLRQQHGGAVCFALGRPGRGCFLGATPEVLVQVSGHTLTTQALAGTARRGADAAHDEQIGRALVASVKDQHEHAVVSQVLRRALETICTDVHSPPEPRLVRLPQVQHLETPFSGRLRKPGGVLDLVERLHPTPSVGGWPVEQARLWLAEHEPLDRGWYAGPIGWLTAAGDGVFAVAIRSVLVRGDIARAYAGAGIVAGSDPDAEWLETELKLRTVQDALQIRRI